MHKILKNEGWSSCLNQKLAKCMYLWQKKMDANTLNIHVSMEDIHKLDGNRAVLIYKFLCWNKNGGVKHTSFKGALHYDQHLC